MESLANIQKALNVPKNRVNDFGLKGPFNYRNAEDILEAVKPLLKKATLVISDDVVKLADDRYYIVATATFKDGEESESAKGCAREPNQPRKKMDESQCSGCASSYARKYALNGLFCLSDVHDADSLPPPEPTPFDNPVPPQTPQSQPSTQAPPQKSTDSWAAPTQVERQYLNILRDFYKSVMPAGKFVPSKLMKLSQLHFARFPNSEQDCNLCKQYIKAAEVME